MIELTRKDIARLLEWFVFVPEDAEVVADFDLFERLELEQQRLVRAGAHPVTREQIEDIVREWQRRLNIPHWRVRINWDVPAPEGVYADVERTGDSYEGAKVRIAADFDTWTLDLANEIIAHELLHLLLADLQAAGESTEEVLTGPAYKLFSHRFMHELEGVVDKLALLLVQFAGPFDPTTTTEEGEAQWVFTAAA